MPHHPDQELSSPSGPAFPELPPGGATDATGVDMRGCHLWSPLDDFEWARGYDQRSGPVHVEHDTLTRTPEDGYHWYRGPIAAHRARTEESAR